MSVLLIVGAGGHACVVADAALSSGEWQSVAFVDDSRDAEGALGFPLVGASADLARLAARYSAAVVGIGNAANRLRLLEDCRRAGFQLPPIVHRTAAVSRYAVLGPGVVVFAQAVINPRTTVEEGCIVNTGATVDHDCHLERGVHVCPGAHLAGAVRVGRCAWIGIGACVKQGVRIGAEATVGAGAAVVSDIESGWVVTGVPARQRRGEEK